MSQPAESIRPFLLDEFLRPIWKFLRYSGFQHGFLGPAEERRVFHILRCVSTTLIILSLFNLEIFELVVLVRVLPAWESSHAVIMNIYIWLCLIMPLAFLLQLYWRHGRVVEFLNDWKRLETSFHHRCHQSGTLRLVAVVKYFFLAWFLTAPSLCVFWNQWSPDASFFLSSVRILRDTFGVHFLAAVQAVWLYYVIALIWLSEIIPAFIFYHAGILIDNLTLELDDCSASILPANENPYRFLWKRYESIQRLVNRANQLFGATVNINYLCYICITCLCVYGIVKSDCDHVTRMTCLSILFWAVLRTVVCDWLFSYLHASCGRLQETVSTCLSDNWHFMSQEERDFLACFSMRLARGATVACPLNLLPMARPNLLLLSIFYAIYTIVILN